MNMEKVNCNKHSTQTNLISASKDALNSNFGENMSTRARIGYKTRNNNQKYNGLVISTYVHMDGDSLLDTLNEQFFSKKQAFDLCFSGHISSLDVFINAGCVLSEEEKERQAEGLLFTSLDQFINAETVEDDLEFIYLYDKYSGRNCWKRFQVSEIERPEVLNVRRPIQHTHIPSLYCFLDFL